MAKQKQHQVSVYLDETSYAELRAAAGSQQRSISWLLCRSWQLSRHTILEYPGIQGWEDEHLAS